MRLHCACHADLVLASTSATFYLAAWGAAVSTLMALLRVAEVLLDRARFRVQLAWKVGSGDPLLYVDVANRGTRTTSVISVGLLIDRPSRLEAVDEPHRQVPGHWVLPISNDITRIEPGVTIRFEHTVRALPPPAGREDPVRPLVVDYRGRRRTGPVRYPFKEMIAFGWTPPEDQPLDDPWRIATFEAERPPRWRLVAQTTTAFLRRAH
jgi:hypothetical protein